MSNNGKVKKFFKSTRHGDLVMDLIPELWKCGHRVYTYARPTDISIVLHGTFENPCIFQGKKVLAYDETDWGKYDEWRLIYYPVLKEYYDDFINITGLTAEEQVEKLLAYEA